MTASQGTFVRVGFQSQGYHTVTVGDQAVASLLIDQGGKLFFWGDRRLGSSFNLPSGEIGAMSPFSSLQVRDFEDATLSLDNPLRAENGGEVVYEGIETLESELRLTPTAVIVADGSNSSIKFFDYGVFDVGAPITVTDDASISFRGINSLSMDPLVPLERNIFRETLSAFSGGTITIDRMGGFSVLEDVVADGGTINLGNYTDGTQAGGVRLGGDLQALNDGRIKVTGTNNSNAPFFTFDGERIEASSGGEIDFLGIDALALSSDQLVAAADGGKVGFSADPDDVGADSFLTTLTLDNAVSLSVGGEIRFGATLNSSTKGYRRIFLGEQTSHALVNTAGGQLYFRGDGDRSMLVFPEAVSAPIDLKHSDARLRIEMFEDLEFTNLIPINVGAGADLDLWGSKTENSSLRFDPTSTSTLAGSGSLLDIKDFHDVIFDGDVALSNAASASLKGRGVTNGSSLSLGASSAVSSTGVSSAFESTNFTTTSGLGSFSVSNGGRVNLEDGNFDFAGSISVDGDGSRFRVNKANSLSLANSVFTITDQGEIIFRGTGNSASQMELLGSSETVIGGGSRLTIEQFGTVSLTGGFRNIEGSLIFVVGLGSGSLNSDLSIPGSLVSEGTNSQITIEDWKRVVIPETATVSADGTGSSVTFKRIEGMTLDLQELSVDDGGEISFIGNSRSGSFLAIDSDVEARGAGGIFFQSFDTVSVNANVRAQGDALINFQGSSVFGGQSIVTNSNGSFTVADNGILSFEPNKRDSNLDAQSLSSSVAGQPIRFFSEVDAQGNGGGVFHLLSEVRSNGSTGSHINLNVDSDIYMTGAQGKILVRGGLDLRGNTVTADGFTNEIDVNQSSAGSNTVGGTLRALNGAGILIGDSDRFSDMSLVWDDDSFLQVFGYLDFNIPGITPGDVSLGLLPEQNHGTIFVEQSAVIEFDDVDNWGLAGDGNIFMRASQSFLRAVDAEEDEAQKSWFNVDQNIVGQGIIQNITANEVDGVIESDIDLLSIRRDGIAETIFNNAGQLVASGIGYLDIQRSGSGQAAFTGLINSGEIRTSSLDTQNRGVMLPRDVQQVPGGFARAVGTGVVWDLDLQNGTIVGGEVSAEEGAVIILGGRDFESLILRSSAAVDGSGGYFEGVAIDDEDVTFTSLSRLSGVRLEQGRIQLTGEQDTFLADFADSEALTIGVGGQFDFIGSSSANIFGIGSLGKADAATLRINGGVFRGTNSTVSTDAITSPYIGARLAGDTGLLDISNPNLRASSDSRLSFGQEVTVSPGMITRMLAFAPRERAILEGGAAGSSGIASQLGGSLVLDFDSGYNPFLDGVNSRLTLFEDPNGVTGNWSNLINGSIFSANIPLLGVDRAFDFRVVQDATSVALEIEVNRIYLDNNGSADSFGDWSANTPSWSRLSFSSPANWTYTPFADVQTFTWNDFNGGIDVDAVIVASSQQNNATIFLQPTDVANAQIEFIGKELIVEGVSGGTLALERGRIDFDGGGINIEEAAQTLDYIDGELSGSLYKSGPGTLRLGGTVFTRPIRMGAQVEVRDGTLQFSKIQNEAGVNLDLSGANSRVVLDSSGTFIFDTLSGVAGSQIQALNGHSADFRVRPTAAANSSSYSGLLRDGSGTLSLEINSLDNSTARFTMDQSGADFSGETRITRGTLALENNFVLSPNSRLNITSNGIVEADGNQRVAGLTGAGRYSGSGILEVLNTAGDDSFSGVLNDLNAGTASLRKSGSNRLTLTGNANTYSGTTFIGSGELAITGVHTGGNRYQIENGGRLLGEGGVITLASGIGNGLQVQNGGTFSYASTFDINGKNVRFDAGSILSIKEFNSPAAATRIGTADFRNVDSFDIADVSTGGLRFDLNVDSGVFSNDRVNIESSASGTLQIGDLGLDQFQLTLNSDVTGQTGTFTLFDSDHTIDGQIDLDNDVIATPDTVPAPRSG